MGDLIFDLVDHAPESAETRRILAEQYKFSCKQQCDAYP